MNQKRTIRKALLIAACLLAGVGMVLLLVAANRKEATRYCKGINVAVQTSGEKLYISENDILTQMQKTAGGPLVDKKIEAINMAALEAALEKHQWIRDAELYFDTHDVLHVTVSEREPIVRMFTTAGQSFYMDSAGQRLPLLPTVRLRLPVVTGFTAAKKWSGRDSAVVKGISAIAQHINSNPFWRAQIAQIDITPAGTFELLPVVGNHLIRIGRAEDIEQKLSNLLMFYKQVLRHTGFDKYAVVDVQYKDQVIGSHERTVSKIDSVQLQRNIQELMKRLKLQAEADSLALVEAAKLAAKDSAVKAALITPAVVENDTAAKPHPKKSVVAKPHVAPASKKSNPVKTNQPQKPAVQNAQPKAVMKKQNA